MSLHTTLLSDLATAMKAQDQKRLDALRLLKAALLHASKATGGSTELTDAEVMTILRSELKKRLDAQERFTQASRLDLADQEQYEAEIIQGYLPAELSDQALIDIIDEVVTGSTTPQFGVVMGQVMQRVGHQASGDRVRTLVQQQLKAATWSDLYFWSVV